MPGEAQIKNTVVVKKAAGRVDLSVVDLMATPDQGNIPGLMNSMGVRRQQWQ